MSHLVLELRILLLFFLEQKFYVWLGCPQKAGHFAYLYELIGAGFLLFSYFITHFSTLH